MADVTLDKDGTCKTFQPGDRVVAPGAIGFDATCNRLVAKHGWTKSADPKSAWSGCTPWFVDDDGFSCRVVELTGRDKSHSKYEMLFR